MTDYTRSTGNSGIMLIRDFFPASNTVELWLTANNTTTWTDHLPWSMIINGFSSGNLTYNYSPPGTGWRRLAVQNVVGSQTIQFRIGSTGTSGFGGPTTFNQFLTRQTVPPAPTTPVGSEITSNSMKVTFHSQGDGQSPIIRWELGWGTNPNGAPLPYTNSSGTTILTGLSQSTTYYFWARGVNALGAGPWSGRGSAATIGVPGINSPPTITDIGQISARIRVNSGGDGGSPMNLIQYGWALNNLDIPPNVISVIPIGSMLPSLFTGLPPGTTLYFRSRTRNSVGWSPWSGPTVARTIAGARVKVGPVWKEAVPYVKDGGVWKIVRPWARIAGIWKQSL